MSNEVPPPVDPQLTSAARDGDDATGSHGASSRSAQTPRLPSIGLGGLAPLGRLRALRDKLLRAAVWTQDRRLTPMLFALAVVLRLKVFADGRSLWGDEAMLALNLAERGFGQLFEPLGWNQAAPIGFLLISRLAVVLLGTSELALRTPGLLAGLALLPMLYLFTRRVAGRRAAQVALALAALAPALVYYSAEVKQYGIDAFVALGLVAFTFHCCVEGLTPRRLVALALAGAAAVWISHPAAFVLAGCGPTLFVSEWRAGRPRAALALALTGLVWLLAFGAHHAAVSEAYMANDYLADYWDGAFLPFPPKSPDDIRVTLEMGHGWLAQMGRSPFADVFAVGERTALLSLVVLVLGGVALWRIDRRLLALLVVPVLAAAGASAAGLYPFQGRLLVFSLPLMLVLLGAGFADMLRPRRRLVGGTLLAGLLAWPALASAEVLLNPTVREEVRPCMSFLAEQAQPGDTVYVYWGMLPSFTWYSEVRELFDARGVRLVKGEGWLDSEQARDETLAQLAGGGRTWIFFAHIHAGPDGDERRAFLKQLDGLGTRLVSNKAPGAWLDLYYLDPRLAAAGSRAAVLPGG